MHSNASCASSAVAHHGRAAPPPPPPPPTALVVVAVVVGHRHHRTERVELCLDLLHTAEHPHAHCRGARTHKVHHPQRGVARQTEDQVLEGGGVLVGTPGCRLPAGVVPRLVAARLGRWSGERRRQAECRHRPHQALVQLRVPRCAVAAVALVQPHVHTHRAELQGCHHELLACTWLGPVAPAHVTREAKQRGARGERREHRSCEHPPNRPSSEAVRRGGKRGRGCRARHGRRRRRRRLQRGKRR